MPVSLVSFKSTQVMPTLKKPTADEGKVYVTIRDARLRRSKSLTVYGVTVTGLHRILRDLFDPKKTTKSTRELGDFETPAPRGLLNSTPGPVQKNPAA